MSKKQNTAVAVSILCQGVSPILFNPMTNDILMTLPGSGLSSGAKKMKEDIQPEDQAAKKVLRNKEGQIGIPAEYLYACLVGAGRMVSFAGKKNISTAETSLLPSFLTIEETFLPFADQDSKWETDIRRVVNRTSKGAMAAVRPRFDTWSFRVNIEVDTGEIQIDKVRALFDAAGKKQGLGDFRPSKKGPSAASRSSNGTPRRSKPNPLLLFATMQRVDSDPLFLFLD